MYRSPDATVTITVVESARRLASLLYHDHLASPPVSVGQGRVDQAFHACPARGYPDGTQFNGGFIVQGRRCVPLDVRVGDQRATRVVLSFGAGRCP